MGKKSFLVALITLVAIFVMPLSSVLATGNEGSSEWNDYVLYEGLNFSAVLNNDGNVETSWTPYAPEGFDYYKVLRDQENSDPVYPDDGYIKALSDGQSSSYTDTEVPTGTSYYRVCSIAKPDRYCSPVVTITSDGSSDTTDGTETLTGITLSASTSDGKVMLSWDLQSEVKSRPGTGETTTDGLAPNGFKIAKSTVNENPTYPVMDGDSYIYLSDSSVRSYTDTDVAEGVTYYYRVCEYLGGSCGVYSNNVSVTVGQCDVTTTETDEAGFTDVAGDEYSTAIYYVHEQGIVEGYPIEETEDENDAEYKPDVAINRAEFLKILIEAKFKDEYDAWDGSLDCFTDISSDDVTWYTKYVCFAKDKGIIDGYPDGSFKPEQTINFVEVAKILVNVYLIEVPQGLGPWYQGFVLALQDGNDVPQTIEELEQAVTRGEMAEFIWRLDTELDDQESATLL